MKKLLLAIMLIAITGCTSNQPRTDAVDKLETRVYPKLEDSLFEVLDEFANVGTAHAEAKKQELLEKISNWKPDVPVEE